MFNIVFTGAAIDKSGITITRDTLIVACNKFGYNVQKSVQRSTNLLVASRADTVKAGKAGAMGIAVMTYPEFLGLMLDGADLTHRGIPNVYTDRVVHLVHEPTTTVAKKALSDIDYL